MHFDTASCTRNMGYRLVDSSHRHIEAILCVGGDDKPPRPDRCTRCMDQLHIGKLHGTLSMAVRAMSSFTGSHMVVFLDAAYLCSDLYTDACTQTTLPVMMCVASDCVGQIDSIMQSGCC